jgi:hypothetical protein
MLDEKHPHRLQLLQQHWNEKKGRRGEKYMSGKWLSNFKTDPLNHNIEQAFCALLFFFFCFGG